MSNFEISSLLEKTRDVLSKSESSSFAQTLKEKNEELQKLLTQYKEKTDFDSKEFAFVSVKDEAELYKNKYDDALKISLKDKDDLSKREFLLHEKMRSFEEERRLFEAKKEILKKDITSINNPSLKKVLSFLDDRFLELDSAKKDIDKSKELLDFEIKQISYKEQAMQDVVSKKQQEVHRIEKQLLDLSTQQEEYSLQLKSLKEKKVELELLVKERSQLVLDINKQYSDSKIELRRIRDQIDKEQQLLSRIREEVQLDQRKLRQERISFEEEKQAFYDKLQIETKDNRQQAESYKKKVLDEVHLQVKLAEEKLDSLRAREAIVQKMESELRQRERKVSKDLDDISRISSLQKDKVDSVTLKLKDLEKQKGELKEYEKEVANLEQTVLELKRVIDSKDKELAIKNSDVSRKEASLKEKEKALLQREQLLSELFSSTSVLDEFKAMFSESKKYLDEKNYDLAKTYYTKASRLYGVLPLNVKKAYAPLLKSLYTRITSFGLSE